MDHLTLVAKFTNELRGLQEQLTRLEQSHLRFVSLVVHAAGGELRLTEHDFFSIPPGAQLYQRIDEATGDLLYKLVAPEPHPEVRA